MAPAVQLRPSICSLFVILILVSAAQSSQQVAVSNSEDISENTFKLAWKLPVGDLEPAAVCRDGQSILLPVFYDGYYLYDSDGQLIRRLPDAYAGFGQLSADGSSALLTTGNSLGLEAQNVSLVDTRTLRAYWNYTLDMVLFAALSPVNMRAAIVGATRLANGSSQELLVVKDGKGIDLLNKKFGESDLESPPAISYNGQYVAIGSWGREERDYWLNFYDIDTGGSWNATVHNGAQFVAMSSDATVIAALGADRLHLFNANGHSLWSAPLPDLLGYAEFPHLWVSDSGEYVAVAGGLADHSYVTLFDRSGLKLWDFQPSSTVTGFAMNRQGSRLVAGDSSGTIYFLDRSGSLLSERNLVSSVRSVVIGGNPEIIIAVGDENTMYVMDTQTNLLWTRGEIGSHAFEVQTSQDGKRTLVMYSSGHSKGTSILDDSGNVVMNGPVSVYPTFSTISSDGRLLVVATSTEKEREQESALAWYDVDSGQQLRNLPLAEGSVIQSLSMSDNAGLIAMSGVVWGNYTFIYALDSQGRQLWKYVSKAEELVGYYEFSYLFSNVAVSGGGSHVAAALREMTVRFWGVCGGNNGVVLFNKQGEQVWNYTIPECVWNAVISENGPYVAATSRSQIYEFDNEGRVLWSRPADVGTIAISNTGQTLIAGDSNGQLSQGNASEPYWQTNVNGRVESVAISDSGDTSAAITSRDHSSTRTARLLYVLNDEGRLLGNYSTVGPWQPTGGSRVTISKNECCIVAAIETEGVYYFVRTSPETQTATVPVTSTTAEIHGAGETQTIVIILLAAALSFGALLFIMKRRPTTKIHGNS